VSELLEPHAIVIDFHRFVYGGDIFDPVGAVHVDIFANIEGDQGCCGKQWGHSLFPFVNKVID
jgi:hypothetical protein